MTGANPEPNLSRPFVSIDWDEQLQTILVSIKMGEETVLVTSMDCARDLHSILGHHLQAYDESMHEVREEALRQPNPSLYPEATPRIGAATGRTLDELATELATKLEERRRKKLNTFKIVGMHFVNAKSLVQVLPENTTLGLVREPTNAYDSNAIQVWIDTGDPTLEALRASSHPELVPPDVTEGNAPRSSIYIEREDGTALRRIGYVPKEIAAGMAQVMDNNGWTQLLGRLVYTGEVLVEVDCWIVQGPSGPVMLTQDEAEADVAAAKSPENRKIKVDFSEPDAGNA